jgi:dTDP-4-amino-4,6-dideoxygalactose transaminase
MIARKQIDIGWRELAFGMKACFWAGKPADNTFCDCESLICLSIRSGFDLLLSELALPAGSEVLISVTIPAMPRILAEHGLVPVPVDIDMSTLSVTAEALRNAVTPQTKAIVVAHLFGSRMDMEPVLAVAREYQLFVIEDCAQAYAGPTFKGHPESDVRMFSFGPIKTATTIGGAVLFIRDPVLRVKMERSGSSAIFNVSCCLLSSSCFSRRGRMGRLSGCFADQGRITTRLLPAWDRVSLGRISL